MDELWRSKAAQAAAGSKCAQPGRSPFSDSNTVGGYAGVRPPVNCVVSALAIGTSQCGRNVRSWGSSARGDRSLWRRSGLWLLRSVADVCWLSVLLFERNVIMTIVLVEELTLGWLGLQAYCFCAVELPTDPRVGYCLSAPDTPEQINLQVSPAPDTLIAAFVTFGPSTQG